MLRVTFFGLRPAAVSKSSSNTLAFPKSVRYLRVCSEPDDRPNAFKPRYSESPLRNRHNRPSLGKGRKNLYVAGMNWSRGDLHENIIRPEFFALKLTLG